MKLKPEDLGPFAAVIVERLVPILQNMNSMPRSIVENRLEALPTPCIPNWNDAIQAVPNHKGGPESDTGQSWYFPVIGNARVQVRARHA